MVVMVLVWFLVMVCKCFTRRSHACPPGCVMPMDHVNPPEYYFGLLGLGYSGCLADLCIWIAIISWTIPISVLGFWKVVNKECLWVMLLVVDAEHLV
ncbi:hypothetical protein F4810DRAFT_667508 [Camillea tinctor]|nr:hypothetical protein F4810DRAFT_667508 [Camillea tinctor]